MSLGTATGLARISGQVNGMLADFCRGDPYWIHGGRAAEGHRGRGAGGIARRLPGEYQLDGVARGLLPDLGQSITRTKAASHPADRQYQ